MFSSLKSDKIQLGVYWGKDAFCIVESNKGVPEKLGYIRFDSKLPGDNAGQKIPEGLRLSALLQQIIREKKITSKKAVLSLSAKDVIYRSFVIPFMQPTEVKNVVEFEITKYIPIKLDDLAHTYHVVPFSEGEQKNLRILFVAIRKNTLEKYCGILQQAGLDVELIEPASVSTIRFLQKNNLVAKTQATAVVELEGEGGKIIIVDKDVVQFVREFQTPLEGSGTAAENSKLFNDVRVSFNFYQRQNPQGKMDRILTLSSLDLSDLCNGFSKEFKISANSVILGKIIQNDTIKDPGIISACGASVREKSLSTKNFDLTIKTAKTAKPSAIGNLTGPMAEWDLKSLGISFAISAGVLYASTLLTGYTTSNNTKQLSSQKSKLGIYDSSTLDNLRELRDGVTAQLNQYQQIRTESEVAMILKKIPENLPPGTWLNNLMIDYADNGTKSGKLSVNFEGYVYLASSEEQLRVVNSLTQKLKNDKYLNQKFQDIILSTSRKDFINNYTVTYFRIICK